MRQFGCIELDRQDLLVLRDCIRPLAKVEPYDPAALIRFCEKVYAAILKLKVNGLETINVPLEEPEALFINQFVGNEDWGNALAVLEQSWLVLYELEHAAAYPHPGVEVPAAVEVGTEVAGGRE